MKAYDYIMMNATHSPVGEFEELRLSFADGGEIVNITVRRFPADDDNIYDMAVDKARERGHLVRYDRAEDLFHVLDDYTIAQVSGYMDDDIREELCGRYDCDTNARFLARYAERDASIWEYLADFDIYRYDLAGF